MTDKSGIIIFSSNKIISIEINNKDDNKSISKKVCHRIDRNFSDIYFKLTELFSPVKRRRKLLYRVKRNKPFKNKTKVESFSEVSSYPLTPVTPNVGISDCPKSFRNDMMNTYNPIDMSNISNNIQASPLDSTALEMAKLDANLRAQWIKINESLSQGMRGCVRPTAVPMSIQIPATHMQGCPFDGRYF